MTCKTPITRLKLRAEWMEDDEQRRKMLADLDELEAMVPATLAFGRDVAGSEPATRLDLAALLRTVLDEAADARPGSNADRSAMTGPRHLPIPARPVALKRAIANLVGNALAYGGAARVRAAQPPQDGMVASHVDDDGPGIPPADWSGCSSRSTGWRPAATARPAAPASACRSPATSCARMAATYPGQPPRRRPARDDDAAGLTLLRPVRPLRRHLGPRSRPTSKAVGHPGRPGIGAV